MISLLKLYMWLLLSDLVQTNIRNLEKRNVYCNICRYPLVHTLCKYPKNGLSEQCFGYDTNSVLKMEDAVGIIQRLNYIRNYIASGSANNTRLPSASNMRQLKWSDELALFAQRWADQCIKRSHPDHVDQCRDTANMSVNQNIATFAGQSQGLTVKGMVDTWFMESLNYKGDVTKYEPPSPSEKHTQHFTQVIWAETFLVGCGRSSFQIQEKGFSSINTIQRLVCNFGPSGNLAEAPVYSPGPPISKCPPGTGAGINFTSLCRELEENAEAYNLWTNNSHIRSKSLVITKFMDKNYRTVKYAAETNSKSRKEVNANDKKIRQVNGKQNSENVDFHRNYGEWHEIKDDYLEHATFGNPVHGLHTNRIYKSHQITTDLPTEITINRPTDHPEIEDTPYKYTLINGRNPNNPTDSGRKMDFEDSGSNKCSRKGDPESGVEATAEICTHILFDTSTLSKTPQYLKHVIITTPKFSEHCHCPCMKSSESKFYSAVTDNSWDCLHTSTDSTEYPRSEGDAKIYTVFATEVVTQEHKRNAEIIPRQILSSNRYRQDRRYCTGIQRNLKRSEAQKTTLSHMQTLSRKRQSVIPEGEYRTRMYTSGPLFVSPAHQKTASKRRRVVSGTQHIQKYRFLRKSLPRLTLNDRYYKTNHILTCTKPSLRVRALKSVTIPKPHKHKSYKLDEKITLPTIKDDIKDDLNNKNNRIKEKYLTFDELMRSRKKQQVSSDNSSIDEDDSIVMRDGRRKGFTNKFDTPSIPSNYEKVIARVGDGTNTDEEKNPKSSECTRKQTCSWTATTVRGRVGSTGVLGCSRTATCSRDNQIDGSRMATPLNSNDICEKRFLDPRETQEQLVHCNLRGRKNNRSRNNRHLRNSTRPKSSRSQTRANRKMHYNNQIRQTQKYNIQSRPTRSTKRIIKKSNSRMVSSLRPMFHKAEDFVLPNKNVFKFSRNKKSRNPRNVEKTYILFPKPSNVRVADFKTSNKRNNFSEEKRQISYNALLKLVTEKFHSLIENSEHVPCDCFHKT